jgi:PAS domain S-box-containing protein
LQAVLLVVAIGLSLWAVAAARSRRSVAGSRAFAWLMIGVAIWSLTGVLHALVPPGPARTIIAVARYLAMAPVGVLWLAFAISYWRPAWPSWITPTVMTAASLAAAVAFAVDYRAMFDDVSTSLVALADSSAGERGRLPLPVYLGLVAALVVCGSAGLAIGLRRFPPPYRPQALAATFGAFLPCIVPLAIVLEWRVVQDPIAGPIAFTVSGLGLAWGLFRYRLFGLVPIARDMVVDNMEDGVLVLDSDRRIIDLNRAAERYTGCSPASVGRSVEEVVGWWTQAVAEDRAAGDHPAVVKAEPGPRYFEVRVTPVRDPERRFAGWLVIVRDISARRRVEADRYALERRRREQQKAESLTAFAAGVAHDFNNLLTGMLGNADLLALEAPRDSAARGAAEAIIVDAQRAADLVSKMLAYAGEGRVVAERVDLDALARETVDLLSATSALHCTLRYESSGTLPLVDADPAQIRQVVRNLIINATEAVDEGGHVTVATGHETLDRAALARMTFGADTEPGRYVFVDVVDNGQGMSEDIAARMFDPFFSTRDQGRGLGLAAVRGIVRSHDAALRVTTAPGQGTRIRVWLSLTPGRQSRAARH